MRQEMVLSSLQLVFPPWRLGGFLLLIWVGPPPAVGWRKSLRCNTTSEFECRNGLCIPVEQVCDHRPHCYDASDESDCHCAQAWLPGMHRCRNKKCIVNFYTCDGKDDCGDGGSDEEKCACYGFRCNDGDCILSTWRCDGTKDCKDYSDEANCGGLLTGGKRHPFLGLIGPVGCLVAALAIRVLLRTHQRRRLLQSNGETATAAEARRRRERLGVSDELDHFDDSMDGANSERLTHNNWVDRFGSGLSSGIAQLRVLFSPGGAQPGGIPPPPPYSESQTPCDPPPAYHASSSTGANISPVFLVVIPAGKPPPSYSESINLPPHSIPISTNSAISSSAAPVITIASNAESHCENAILHNNSTVDTPVTLDLFPSSSPFVSRLQPAPSSLTLDRHCSFLTFQSAPTSLSPDAHPTPPTFQSEPSSPLEPSTITIRHNPLTSLSQDDVRNYDHTKISSLLASPGLPPSYEEIFCGSSEDCRVENFEVDGLCGALIDVVEDGSFDQSEVDHVEGAQKPAD